VRRKACHAKPRRARVRLAACRGREKLDAYDYRDWEEREEGWLTG
jgi:hypothetical protein